MRLRILPVIFSLLLSCHHYGSAQIIKPDQDPARIKWYQIKTEGFKLIYPEGYDSLAVKYAEIYAKYRVPVSLTSGFLPAKLPVVLHPENASASYALTQFPSRIDMSVLPQGHYVFSYPVHEMAAISLSRQASHLNFASSNVFRPFTWLLGELFPAAVNMLYPDTWLLDGDAAAAATALVPGGYGRYGDFLNYYMAALDAGDVRGYKWDRWAIGSYNKYTPGTDAFGYMILSGLRTLYDKPDYAGDYMTRISKRPYDIFYGTRLSRKTTGENLHTSAFRTIFDYHREIFSRELALRSPFTSSEPVLPDRNGKYTEYISSAVLADGSLFAVRKSMERSPSLVRISPDGNIDRISSFSDGSSRPVWSETLKRLYWSETAGDWRWKQRKYNIIRYYDSVKDKTESLVLKTNVFNPSLSPDGLKIAAIYAPEPEKTSVIIIDALSGNVLYILPFNTGNTLLTECAWCSDGIYACGVSEAGSSVYKAIPGKETGMYRWEEIIGPSRCTVRNLSAWENSLVFSCDASGVFDLYLASSDSGKWDIFRLTSEKYGARDFVFDGNGDTLYFSRMDHLGYDLRKVSSENLFHIPVSLDTVARHEVASELALQEAKAGKDVCTGERPEISEPSRYRKGLHLFRLHSWAPVYCNLDKLSDLNGEKIYDYASVGATVLTQNTLGTAYGSAGYCWRPDPDGTGWVHGGHISFTYAGWYPVIEGSLNINDRLTWNYIMSETGVVSRSRNTGVSLAGKIKIYLPLSKELGGKTLNFTPEISWELDNNKYNGLINHTTTISCKFNLLRDMAKAEVFPRLGIGAESGIRTAVAVGSGSRSVIKLGDSWYLHAYGYFPGIGPGQGGKLSLTTQMLLNKGIYNPASEILPRGLEGSIMKDFYSPVSATLLTLDYAVPIYLGDINITPLIYLNRMIITPHFDYCFSTYPEMHLCSAGSSLTFQLGRLLWSFPLEIGVDYSYNFGTLFSIMSESGSQVIRHSVKPVIRISF